MDLYTRITHSKSDVQVVPDDGYNSPVHSPYYGESAKSPADSVTSSADSAYEELAEVIPDLKDADNNTDEASQVYSGTMPDPYSDILNLTYSNMLPYDLYNTAMYDQYAISNTMMNEATLPHSNSEYAESLSPSGSLMQAVAEEASASRSFTQAQAATINLCDFWEEETQKQQTVTEPEALVAYMSLLSAKNSATSEQKTVFMVANEDSGICVDSQASTIVPEPPRTENVNNLLPSHPLIPEDGDLVKKFSVLAEYLDAKPAQECQQTEPNNMPQSQVSTKVEESEETPMDVEDGAGKGTGAFSCQGNLDSPQVSDAAEWIKNVLHIRCSQASSFVQPTQSTFVSNSLERTTTQMQQQTSSQLLVAELCKKVSQTPSGVMFFNIAKDVKETEKTPEERQTNVSITLPIDHKKVFSKWKRPTKPTKKLSLHSHSSKPRLYNFLFDLLNDPNARCIEWLNEEQGIFKFINSGEVARLWGQRKNKPNMKYENFARSLRTYVAKGILTKPRNKLVYQFTPDYL